MPQPKPVRDSDNTVSDDAVELNRDPNDARSERVAQLRAEYLKGTYHVDVREVSAKIVQRHLRSK
jgi:anti-sigma28 factor (negative regulator of flagellin synthesis)